MTEDGEVAINPESRLRGVVQKTMIAGKPSEPLPQSVTGAYGVIQCSIDTRPNCRCHMKSQIRIICELSGRHPEGDCNCVRQTRVGIPEDRGIHAIGFQKLRARVASRS